MWLIPEKNVRQQWRSRTQKYDQETELAQSSNHSHSFNQIMIESQFHESLSQVLNSGCSLNSEPIANPTNAKLLTSIRYNSIIASSTKMARYFWSLSVCQALSRWIALNKGNSSNIPHLWALLSVPRWNLFPLSLESRLDWVNSLQPKEHEESDFM